MHTVFFVVKVNRYNEMKWNETRKNRAKGNENRQLFMETNDYGEFKILSSWQSIFVLLNTNNAITQQHV